MASREVRPKAVLVAVHLPDMTDAEFESGLDELGRLVTTLGYEPIRTITQARTHLEAASVLGEGKLKELAELTGGTGQIGGAAPKRKEKARLRRMEAESEEANEIEIEAELGDEDEDSENASPKSEDAEAKVALVAVDHDITPSQARNLERATGTSVLDRTGVIIDIFHRHAKSREARLQVEIARLTYTAPRLRESPGGKERQRGRGAGEAALELDRRKIRDRIAELKQELGAIARDQDVRRAHRRDARRVALVGYTNAGKSSLMRALTGSDVYVENKLFATLDTTVRALYPEAKPRILVSDTVGFIRKLPHDLVASFKSTLDEALEASHLLHVIDASDPAWESQYAVTRDVLEEIGAGTVSATLVMNKIDRVEPLRLNLLRKLHPEALFISAHSSEDVTRVRRYIIDVFEAAYEEGAFVVPYGQQAVISEMHDCGRVVEESYEDDGVHVVFRADREVLGRVRAKLERSP